MTVAGDFRSRPSKTRLAMGQGRQLLKQARRQFRRAIADPYAPTAEAAARKALANAYMAFNWLEDTEREEEAHKTLHSMGKWTREHFPRGCMIPWTGERYERTCPVQLGHIRLGFSPGMIVGAKLCSLCGQDVSECSHLSSREYLVPGGNGPLGRCRVCMRERCRHSPDREYWTRPTALVTEVVEVLEISMVSRPVQPAARLTGRPVDPEALRAHLGPRFRYGVDVVECSQCLVGCEGFTRFRGDPRLSEASQAV